MELEKIELKELVDIKYPWYQQYFLWPIERFFYRNPKVYYKETKWFFQKIIRGYSDCDLWGLDHHLAELIYPRLKAFYEMERMGYPAFLEDDYSKQWKETFGDDAGEKYWDRCLFKMLKSFEYLKDPFKAWEHTSIIDERIKIKKEIDEGLLLFAKYFNTLWD